MRLRRNRASVIAAIIAALTACGPPLPAPEEGRSANGPADRSEATMQDMVLRLYGGGDGDGTAGRPTFRVHAARSTLLEDGVWSFEDARAVIYDQQGNETLIEAARGQVDQRDGREAAMLEQDVSLRAGGMTLQLERLEWANAERAARSDAPVRMTGDEAEATASGLSYFPDARRVILSDVRGSMTLKGDDTP